MATSCVVAQENGHRYKNGRLIGRQICAIVIENILCCSDRELPDKLEEYNLLNELDYKKKPHYSVSSKVRKLIGSEAINKIFQFIIQQYYKDRRKIVRLIAIDSTFIQTYSKQDKGARYGYVTTPKRDQYKNKKQKSLKQGYKQHTIYDVETDIPLYTKILPANIHDSQVFEILFEYVKQNFNIAINAKFLAESVYDSTKIYEILRYYNITPAIAENGRGHYKSKKPKDLEYGKRWAIERFFSKIKRIKRKLNLLNNRFFGLERVSFHVNTVLLAYLIRYINLEI